MTKKTKAKEINTFATIKRTKVVAKSDHQQQLIDSINENKITICFGPAGSGKTHIASAMGVLGLFNAEYERLVICRPFVQADEDIGHLPGDIEDKLKPALRPVYDELKLYLSYSQLVQGMNQEAIEVIPFAWMRGRNLHNSFIVADEAQNATISQLKMLITRIGRGSKMVINGDFTQSDLPINKQGGLTLFANLLRDVEGIGVVKLDASDIIRDPIVAKVVTILENHDDRQRTQEGFSS